MKNTKENNLKAAGPLKTGLFDILGRQPKVGDLIEYHDHEGNIREAEVKLVKDTASYKMFETLPPGFTENDLWPYLMRDQSFLIVEKL